MVKLGDKARDRVTGFEGIATGKAEYLTGCVQVCLTPRVDSDGKRRDGEWFDEDRLEAVDAPKLDIMVTKAGGPQSNAAPTY